jgi:hypothetical protein
MFIYRILLTISGTEEVTGLGGSELTDGKEPEVESNGESEPICDEEDYEVVEKHQDELDRYFEQVLVAVDKGKLNTIH